MGFRLAILFILIFNFQAVFAQSDTVAVFDNFILLKSNQDCGEGGMCEYVYLTSYSKVGKEISSTIFSSGVGDCGFEKTDDNILFNDTLIITLHREWKGNCMEEFTESESLFVREFHIWMK